MILRVLKVIDRPADRCVFDPRTSKAYFMDTVTYGVFSKLSRAGVFDPGVMAAQMKTSQARAAFQEVLLSLSVRGLVVLQEGSVAPATPSP